MKSDDLRSRYTSAGLVHRSGEDIGSTQAASYTPQYAFVSECEGCTLTLGDEKFNFGKTASYSNIACLILSSSSGKAKRSLPYSLSDSPAESSISSSSSDNVL